MDYEKAYKEALERAKKLQETCDSTTVIGWMEYIFPKLKESEDERIRKAIIYLINQHKIMGTVQTYLGITEDEMLAWLEKKKLTIQNDESFISKDEKIKKDLIVFLDDIWHRGKNANFDKYGKADCAEWIAWLEKQGEQNHTDKVEPKFKQGDWISNGRYTRLVVGITDKYYTFKSGDCMHTDDVEKKYHLWTIKDAKDGDVLVASDNSIFIYAGSTDRHAQFYIALSKCGKFNIEGGNWEDKNSVHPATKEQRDQLEKAMADAGYTFDYVKKELKKIEQKPAKWSKEDEKAIALIKTSVMDETHLNAKGKHIVECWLKDRVQPKQEWSEEDESFLKDAIDYFNVDNCLQHKEKEIIYWLKSIKERLGGK